MSLVQQIARVSANIEAVGRVNEFVSACRYLMLSPRGGADLLAEQGRAGSKVVEFCRAAVTAGSTTAWPSNLAVFQNLASAFLGSLTGVSVFDTLLPSMLQVPPRTTVVAVSTSLSAGAISESNIKPISRISLTASDLDVTKCATFVALSAELLHMGNPSTLTLLQRELRTAITRATNTLFLSILTTGITSFTSSGVTSTAVRQDIRVLLAAVNSGAESKLFLITTRRVAETWTILTDTAGAPAFPNARVNGGEIGGIPIIVCDEVTDGEILLVDATQIAAASEALILDSSTQATIQLDAPGDSPVTAATVMTSLWQADLAAIRAERFIGAKLLRSDCIARIQGAAYSGNSPA